MNVGVGDMVIRQFKAHCRQLNHVDEGVQKNEVENDTGGEAVVERFIDLLLEYNEWVIEQPAEKVEDKYRIHLGVLGSFQEMAHQVHQWY